MFPSQQRGLFTLHRSPLQRRMARHKMEHPTYASLGGHWCTIESTSAVFNSLVQKNGIRGAFVKEVWSLDSDLFAMLKSEAVYGFVLLLRLQGGRLSKAEEMIVDDVNTSNIYFANQVIPDACGTQALLAIAMNVPEMQIGPMLNDFREFTLEFEPKDKGLAMTNCKQLRENHNSLSGQYERQPTLPLSFLVDADSLEAEEHAEDVFHYVSFVQKDGYVWELDGLQPGPLRLMPCTEQTWLDVVRIELQARVKSYAEEDRFALLAVVKDPLIVMKENLARLQAGEADISREKEIAEVERAIRSLEKEREVEQCEVAELEADFSGAIQAFMEGFLDQHSRESYANMAHEAIENGEGIADSRTNSAEEGIGKKKKRRK